MKKIIFSLYTTGIALISIAIPSVEDFLYNILYKKFEIDMPHVNGCFCMIIGVFALMLATFLLLKTNKKEKTISIIGLDSKYQADDLPDTYMIDIRDSIRKLNSNSSKKIIKDFISDIDKFIDNNLNKSKSYYGVAPIPFIAITGTKFRKEKIINHYEYDSSSDKVDKLNYNSTILLPKMKVDRLTNDDEDSILCISTTSKISERDIKQFSKYNISHFYLEKCDDNRIVSEKQLRKYSDLIVKEIYDISKLKTGKIYLIGACQSSLIFEIFRKINFNRTLEIIVCNYNKTSIPRYNWGLCLKNNEVKYIDLGEQYEKDECNDR